MYVTLQKYMQKHEVALDLINAVLKTHPWQQLGSKHGIGCVVVAAPTITFVLPKKI